MADGLVLPRVQAMVLCDEIDERSDEPDVCDLKGVRNRVYARSFPYTHAQLWVCLQLSGHEGRATCRVEVLRAANDHVIHEVGEEEIEFSGPLEIVHWAIAITNCDFPSPGLYYVQVYHGTKLIHERLLDLVEGTANGQATE
jgi:hypothetical protein